jgi:hypothetical protein
MPVNIPADNSYHDAVCFSICPGHNIRSNGGQLLVLGALGCALPDLLHHALWRLVALHEPKNSFLAPHFLQIPKFFSSINQW